MTTDEPRPPRLLPIADPRSAGPAPVFDRVAVIGLGLMGGSIAMAARQAWPSAMVIGVDRHEVIEKAMVHHAIDVASPDLMIASEADLVVLATPVGAILELLTELPGHLAASAVITDVGGTKRAIVDAARALPPRLAFVGGHPLAGATRSGFDAARPDLFVGRPWLLTSIPGEQDDVVSRLSAFVQALGARPVTLPSAADHDRLVAFLSHLPQLTASVLMAIIGESAGDAGLALAGRGLLDTTRLASSPASVWQDVCRTNADEIGAAIDRVIAELQEIRQGLADADTIERAFERANRWRERLESLRSST